MAPVLARLAGANRATAFSPLGTSSRGIAPSASAASASTRSRTGAGSGPAGPSASWVTRLPGRRPVPRRPAAATSSTASTAWHQRQRTCSIRSSSTSDSSTCGSPPRSRWTYSRTRLDRVTSKRVRFPHWAQRQRVCGVGGGTGTGTPVRASFGRSAAATCRVGAALIHTLPGARLRRAVGAGAYRRFRGFHQHRSRQRTGHVRRAGHPAGRGHLRGGRPGDHRRVAGRLRDHRVRRGEGPRRGGARRVPEPGQPGRPDPGVRPGAHRHHRPDGGRRAARRGGAARLPGVLPRLRCSSPTTRRSTSAS